MQQSEVTTLNQKVEEKSIARQEDLKGKHVLLRVDTNTSLGENGKVDTGEDWRISRILPTLHLLQERGAKVVMLAHQGRDPQESTFPIFQYLQDKVKNIFFQEDYEQQAVEQRLQQLEEGAILFMENVRRLPEEKEGRIEQLQVLVDWADLFVNEAFAVSHRKHASVYLLPQYLPAYFGLQFVEEVKHLSSFLIPHDSLRTMVLGGAKFGTKLPLIKKMLEQVDFVLLGGALANVFLKERGIDIGKSFVDESVDIHDIAHHPKIVLPVDYVDEHGDIAPILYVGAEHQILDIGTETEQLFRDIIVRSKQVLWNGPMGKYEDGYIAGSVAVAEAMAESDAYTLTGGGDTSTVILEQGLEKDFDFISTGGGAMLEFLVEETLPGIEAILKGEEK